MAYLYAKGKLSNKNPSQCSHKKNSLYSQEGESTVEGALILTFFFIIFMHFININTRLNSFEQEQLKQFKKKWNKLERHYGKIK
tara:strand:+ start:153 stop:404 length:252 start_codon:yes stop_codon:yes gene_type:complete